MALHSGVSGAGAVCKPPPVSAGKALRRRRGSLVRCRAYVWSKDDLARLDALALRPREASMDDPLLRETDHDAAQQEFSVLFCKHFRVGDDGYNRSLRRVPSSDTKLFARQRAWDTVAEPGGPKDEPEAKVEEMVAHKYHQSPTQQPLQAVTGIASTLIDLTL